MGKVGSILTTLACIALVAFFVYYCCLRNRKKRGPNGEPLPAGSFMDNVRNMLPNSIVQSNRNINDEIQMGGGGGVQITEVPQHYPQQYPGPQYPGPGPQYPGGQQYNPNYPNPGYPPQGGMPMPMPIQNQQFQQGPSPYPPPAGHENPPPYNNIYPK